MLCSNLNVLAFHREKNFRIPWSSFPSEKKREFGREPMIDEDPMNNVSFQGYYMGDQFVGLGLFLHCIFVVLAGLCSHRSFHFERLDIFRASQ